MKTLDQTQYEALARLQHDRDFACVIAWIRDSIQDEVTRMLCCRGVDRDEAAGGIIQLREIVKQAGEARDYAEAMAKTNLSAGGIP
jgi:hypothetical protein